ncbi:NAD(P)-binding protein [Pseudodesulfovibrio cashew]|uniref:NAD(P)-binding protein n=1 Tax=Pseudodesulfovibrio cashew TaxID=2678688 RepID=A0A6I6JLE9_9BACT|nr:FAD-dependent oxidoreductase [Pseudodesulfovibrio cashew]QGY41083.1 NAD(P)-binding protein [Pseudodesulfovibrio cashew]
MAEYDFDIGIIGGGAAGLTVASGAAQLGARTLLVERAPRLGGDCLHYGCVPSKTLIRTAAVYHRMRTAERYGLPSVDLPPVDFRQVATRIQTVIDRIQVHDSEERFCSLGVKVVFGLAFFVDEHTVECGGKRVTARKWVVATGSSPAGLPVPGLEETGYWTNKDIFSLDELPETLLVMGGGPIACEMAQAFSRLGCEVTVLQRNTQLLSREDRDMAEVVADSLRAEGIHLELGAAFREVRRTGGGVEVEFERDGEVHTARGVNLLVAAGRRTNVEGLGLDNAGVSYDHKGIAVDDRLRTSQKHIFAAGDVTGKYLFTHAAGYEGGVIIANAVLRLPRRADYTWLPWCTYTEPELASVGMNEKAAQKAGREHAIWIEEFADNDRALAEGATGGRIKLVLDRREKPLGVQIAGPHAGELASEWVAALNSGTGLSTLASAVHPYPTLAEINKRVAGRVMSPKLFSGKVRKALSFLFGYKGRACQLD